MGRLGLLCPHWVGTMNTSPPLSHTTIGSNTTCWETSHHYENRDYNSQVYAKLEFTINWIYNILNSRSKYHLTTKPRSKIFLWTLQNFVVVALKLPRKLHQFIFLVCSLSKEKCLIFHFHSHTLSLYILSISLNYTSHRNSQSLSAFCSFFETHTMVEWPLFLLQLIPFFQLVKYAWHHFSLGVRLVRGVEKWEDRKWRGDRKVRG